MQPRKRFGQHFLCDQTIIERIVETLNPKISDHLVEIGPGQGALTLPVLKKTGALSAIELDRDLIKPLMHRCNHAGVLTLYDANVLKFDFAQLMTQSQAPLRIFGNLPYNISTQIIFHLLDYVPLLNDMLFMFQKEVGERIVAAANTEAYGRLSVMVQYHFKVRIAFHISPNAFYPPPNVTSSLVHFLPQTQALAKDYALFAEVVKEAFNQRRKTLRNSLRKMVDDSLWAHIPVHSDLRAENLTVKDFIQISNAITLEKT